jgi:hypothetical protein
MDKEYTKRASKKDKKAKTFDIYGKNTTKGLRRKMEILEITESTLNIQTNNKNQ